MHSCSLLRALVIHLQNQCIENGDDPDQDARMHRLILDFSVHTTQKGHFLTLYIILYVYKHHVLRGSLVHGISRLFGTFLFVCMFIALKGNFLSFFL